MADEHHEDHGNTVAGWFLTVSWIVVWTVAAVAIIIDENLVMWSVAAGGVSVVCAVIAGIMKKAGLGRKHARPVPPTRDEWAALQAEQQQRVRKAESEQTGKAAEKDTDGAEEPADEATAAH